MSIVLVRFFELLIAEDTRHGGLESDSLFLFGLLSLLDVDMDQLLPILSLQEPLAQGLLTGKGRFGSYLKLATAIETADSKTISQQARLLQIEKHLISGAWREAMLWSNEIEQQAEF